MILYDFVVEYMKTVYLALYLRRLENVKSIMRRRIDTIKSMTERTRL